MLSLIGMMNIDDQNKGFLLKKSSFGEYFVRSHKTKNCM